MTVGSGKEALTRIEEEDFDLVVADLVMPGMSGLEVLERTRSFAPAPDVILITGHASVETAIEALRKGAFDYLQKPFQLEDLASCVERLLRHRDRPGAPAPAGRDRGSRGRGRSSSGRAGRCRRCAPRSPGAAPRRATC